GSSPVQAEYFSQSEGLGDADTLLFEDRQGSIWVATPDGVDQFRQGSFVPPVGLLKQPFPALLPGADNGLRFGGPDSELRYLSAGGAVNSVDRLFVTCAHRDPNGVDWYGSQPRAPAIAELIRRESARVQRIALPADIPPEVDVQAITTDLSGAVWVSVIRKGIYRLVNDAWTRPSELLDAGKLPAIMMMTDSRGHVWLGYPANRV